MYRSLIELYLIYIIVAVFVFNLEFDCWVYSAYHGSQIFFSLEFVHFCNWSSFLNLSVCVLIYQIVLMLDRNSPMIFMSFQIAGVQPTFSPLWLRFLSVCNKSMFFICLKAIWNFDKIMFLQVINDHCALHHMYAFYFMVDGCLFLFQSHLI